MVVILFECPVYLCLHRQQRVFDRKWRVLPLLQRSEDWLQLLLSCWIQPEDGQENLSRWEEGVWVGHDQVTICQLLSLKLSPDLLLLHLQTLMNVLSQTLAVRSASTCPAATSATVRVAMRLTLQPKHAKLNQVILDRKAVPAEYLLIRDTFRYIVLYENLSFLLLQVLFPPCTSPTNMRWGKWRWIAASTSVWSHNWKMQLLWIWTCPTRWSSGLTCLRRKSTG